MSGDTVATESPLEIESGRLLTSNIERLLAIERNILEALFVLKLFSHEVNTVKYQKHLQKHLQSQLYRDLEKASGELSKLEQLLASDLDSKNQKAAVIQFVINLIPSCYLAIFTAISYYYHSGWLQIDLPESVNPLSVVLNRPAELFYSMMAYLTFHSGGYLWTAGCLSVAAFTSYRTTYLKQCILNGTGPALENQFTCASALVTFRLLATQIFIYTIKKIEPQGLQQQFGHIVTHPFTFTFRELPSYSPAIATLLAVFVGVIIGF